MTKRIACALQKGGVGKTTSTVATVEKPDAVCLLSVSTHRGTHKKILKGGNTMNKKEAAQTVAQKNQQAELVGQLTHENDEAPDFTEIAKKLEKRKAQETKGENEDHVKMTIYIRSDIAHSFNALITKRGQQKEYANQAFADFIQKKTRELGL